mgnify:CR=1 FL=1
MPGTRSATGASMPPVITTLATLDWTRPSMVGTKGCHHGIAGGTTVAGGASSIAALLLTVMSYNSLFLGTVAGFAASALLVVSVLLPSPKASEPRGVYDRTTRGIRIYLATPRLRGLLALNLAAAAAGAMGAAGSAGETYIGMMRENVLLIVNALK